jgi:hypothetical protein
VKSERFGRIVVITAHAWTRMTQRDMDDSLLLDLIETGTGPAER